MTPTDVKQSSDRQSELDELVREANKNPGVREAAELNARLAPHVPMVPEFNNVHSVPSTTTNGG